MTTNPWVVFAITSAAAFLVWVDPIIAVAAFLVCLPFGALILFFALHRLPILKGADAGEGPDIPGIAPIVGGVAALTYGVVQEKGAGFTVTVQRPALAGLALLIAYALWARGRKGAAIYMTLL